MKKGFPLAAVLRVRSLRETIEQRELARVVRTANELRDEIEQIDARLSRDAGTRNVLRNAAFDPQTDMLFFQHMERLARRRAELAGHLARVERGVEDQRAIMMETRKDRQAMDALKTRFDEQETFREAREENLRLSEIAIMRHGRGENLG
ncbi:hypothetical protein K8I61_06605 [bacterium]|nr:hypothetical protein [bacterium]